MKYRYSLSQLVWAIVFIPLLALPAWAKQISIAEDIGRKADNESQGTGEGEQEVEIPHPTAFTPSYQGEDGRGRSSIPQLRELDHPATTVEEWMTEIAQSLTQVTQVQVSLTETGLNVILQTGKGLTVPSPSTVGNALIIDISNAVLKLPEAEEFSQANPAEGIASVTATNLPGDRIRVTITGTDAPPTVQISSEAQQLVLSVAIKTATTGEEEEIEVVVTGEQNEGYNPSEASTATRTDTPLRDIPQSIQVVPRQVIEDQGITRVSDATRNVSGTTIVSGYGNLFGDVNIRGFFSSPLRDGFSSPSFFTNGANIERVEVLKGPASVLYGQGEPGGVVNYVTEQPLSDPYYSAEFIAGSYDFYQGSIDLTGPLTEDEQLLYRLNVSYENSGSYRNFINNDILFIAPTVTYRISDSTNLTLAYEYLDAEQGFDRGLLPASPFLEMDRSLNIGEPDDFQHTENHRVNLTLNHQFNQNLRLRSSFLYLAEELESIVTQPGELAADDRTLPDRGYFGGLSRYDNYALQTDLIGEFNTGSIDHQLLLGLELRLRHAPDESISGTYTDSFDIFDPIYGSPRIPNPNSFFEQTTDTVGVYLQDQVTLLPNLKLLVGGRYDFVWNNSEFISDTSIDSTLR